MRYSLFLVWLVAAQCAFSQEPFPLRDAVECTPREGLPNVKAKIEAGDTLKIGYLGGSITAASGWRVQSRDWFAETYPEATFEEIHAAIGGTGSDLGVFRLHNDVLRHDPDLVFVEFAVNDGGAAPERIHKSMEGIVRQIWKFNPEIDICFVYTLTDKMLGDLHAGKMPRAASAMEVLADHYAIPSIHFGVKVAAMEKSGELVFKAPKPDNIAEAKPLVFSSDGVHPHTQTGHKIYSETIARSWPAIWAASGKAGAHSVPAPVREDNWENAKQVAITPAMLKGAWTKLDEEHTLAKRFRKNMPTLYKADEAGASLEFKFEGTTASVFDLLGPDGGLLKVQVDGGDAKSVKRIDGYCTYHRMSKTGLASELPSQVHEVKVTLSDEKIDKRNVLFEKNREYFDKNEDRYKEHTWYAGSLLIIGDIVK